MTAGGGEPHLSAFQLEVTQLFFALPASRGFLLAGGAALLAQHLTARPTEDLDFFTASGRGHVLTARDALEAAARERGWSTQRIHDSGTFCRMIIGSADAEVLVDLAINAPPDLPASVTPAGPTLAPEELAGHKLLALFDRAAARDFADVYVLAHRFGKDVLLTGRPDRRGLRRQRAGRHDHHARPVHGRRDPRTRRLVCSRSAGVLRNLAIRACTISQTS
jgi:Nucleotidyl transferase AbiEii toxin, Type IV TA system